MLGVQVKAESYWEVYVPIAPQVDRGVITIKMQTISQINRQDFKIELEIMVCHLINQLTHSDIEIEYYYQA